MIRNSERFCGPRRPTIIKVIILMASVMKIFENHDIEEKYETKNEEMTYLYSTTYDHSF